ncbi:MAG TPA: sialate O-acetylesterase [Agriterribacter sp.]|nr:sialate O-acetylesterase [Agriterribacter sp.]
MKWLIIFIAFLPTITRAQLKLPKIFSDNMVLQRDQPIHVWGKGTPATIVTINFSGQKTTAKVSADSTWNAYFKQQHANIHPQSLDVSSGDQKIKLENILVGDVWVCIGQSNMEFPMQKEMHFKEEIAFANQPLIRLYNPTYAGKNTYGKTFPDSVARMLTPQHFYRGNWENCDSNSVGTMSAVPYYFGKAVLNRIHIPVGLINLAIGGAPLETFISTSALQNDARFAAKLNGDWLWNNALPVWVRERGVQNVGELTNIPSDEYGKNHAFKPGFAWSGGIEPILPMPVKGILCYQGESNAQEIQRVEEYGALTSLLVDEYRKGWKQPRLPFYYVQLSAIDTVKYKGQLWPQFRDEQRKMMTSISNSGMAVCSDIGFRDDVHPTNKKAVGDRLANWALDKTYHINIVPSGPLPLKAVYKRTHPNDPVGRGEIIVSFRYADHGLGTPDGEPLRGFYIDGVHEIPATIHGKNVIIPVKTKPAFVYYGWKSFTDANLVNAEQLPASTFKIKVE